MLRVVLVDDEPSVLEGLFIFADWRNMGFEVVGTASDGTSALSIVKDKRPDLIVSDIRMPGLTGLELMERINTELDPAPKFMILSGYSDFAYAQKALQLGALGYLSKPLDADELTSELSRAAREIEKERSARQENIELVRYSANQVFNDILDGRRCEKLKLKARSIFGLRENAKLKLIKFITDISAEAKNSPTDDIYKLLMQITGIENENCIFFNGAGSYIIIINDDMPVFDHHAMLQMHLAEQLEGIEPEKYGCQAFWALISDVSAGEVLDSIYKCGKQLEKLNTYCMLHPECYVLDYKFLERNPVTLKEAETVPFAIFPDQPFERIVNALKGNDPVEVSNAVNEFFDKLNHDMTSRRLFSIYLYRLADVVGKMAYAYGIEAGRVIFSFTEAVGALNPNCKRLALEMCAYIFERVNSNNVKPLIMLENEIIDYTKANYMKSLSLQKIAEKFSLPAIIISKIIKKKTGHKFNDYINYLRIEHAKALFASSDMKTASVCEESGYTDYGYFVEKFKEFTGVSPSEYKKRYS